jgi:hypothetical protein
VHTRRCHAAIALGETRCASPEVLRAETALGPSRLYFELIRDAMNVDNRARLGVHASEMPFL